MQLFLSFLALFLSLPECMLKLEDLRSLKTVKLSLLLELNVQGKEALLEFTFILAQIDRSFEIRVFLVFLVQLALKFVDVLLK